MRFFVCVEAGWTAPAKEVEQFNLKYNKFKLQENTFRDPPENQTQLQMSTKKDKCN